MGVGVGIDGRGGVSDCEQCGIAVGLNVTTFDAFESTGLIPALLRIRMCTGR